MSRINPDDVFPARNLPGEAEKWGRSIEDEVKKLREQQEITNQLLSGQNRGNAASLAALADQFSTLVGVDGGSTTTSDFGLTSGSWVTVADTNVTTPPWGGKAVITGAGMAFVVSNDAFAVPSVRLLIGGVSSMEVELPQGTGASAIPFFGTLAYTRNISVSPGSVIATSLQVYVLDSSLWYTGAGNRKAQISSTAVFTR